VNSVPEQYLRDAQIVWDYHLTNRPTVPKVLRPYLGGREQLTGVAECFREASRRHFRPHDTEVAINPPSTDEGSAHG
jgi:hypothetical protein